ncbi:hypothetical protein BK634_13200 [Pseudomonas chlororaphis]|nr:hypothetical protein BK634_13200 [Pseudomonas chlororaphis]
MQILITWRDHVLALQHESKHLPGITFQRRQPTIQQQATRHDFVRLATEQKSSLLSLVGGWFSDRACGPTFT